jgi:uncharacterized membrane protein YecN with MAPEG domain
VDALHRVFAALLVVLLLGLAVFVARRQLGNLRDLRDQDSTPPEDRRYLRNQARRRLVSSGLLVLLAAMLAGWFLLDLGEQTLRLGEQGEEQRARGEEPVLDAEQQRLLNLSASYVIGLLLLLLLLLALAGVDIWAIHRFGQRHRRQIQADRRAMIERQAARLRSRRNGQE